MKDFDLNKLNPRFAGNAERCEITLDAETIISGPPAKFHQLATGVLRDLQTLMDALPNGEDEITVDGQQVPIAKATQVFATEHHVVLHFVTATRGQIRLALTDDLFAQLLQVVRNPPRLN